jgi:[protein-PII] uridylyltransferase
MSDPRVAPHVTQWQATARERICRAQDELATAAARGEGGREALRLYADAMDEVVEQLYAHASIGSASERPDPIASSEWVGVFALGGYGRRQLWLHSDVDLLVVFADPIGAAGQRFLQAFFNPLWDLGLTVGHHVRELKDASASIEDNPEFLLALTDARAVAGSAALLDRFAHANDGRAAARTLSALKSLIEERHARFNDTLYQLEPDVKDAPGGLRDLFAAFTVARLSDPTLLGQGGAGLKALHDAEEFLFRVRSILHLESKRNANVLTHELQERAAERLGYPGATARQRVERLMSAYFRHARAVDRSLRWVLRASPLPIGTNLVQGPDGVRFVDVGDAANRPDTWLALFDAAVDRGAPVAGEALAMVAEHAPRFSPETFLPTAAHRAALVAFLTPRPGLYARLSEMHDCGLLGQLFPEFKAITSRVVRDFYHKYTVDEHTLLTIRNIERLLDPASPRRRFAPILGELDAPQLLVLALLYHDVGKWRDDDHHIESCRMAQQMISRLELSDDAGAMVEFLVLHHLKMSLAAFRRDTEDPEVVRQFADIVGVEERLKMLCLMTLADVEAVSPESLTNWKEELLWRLYVDTYNRLTLSYGDEVIDERESRVDEIIAGRPADLAADETRRFLEGLPRRYLRLFARQDVYHHVRLARDVGANGIGAWIQPKAEAVELTVLTRDRPYLFSNISGLLSSYGMDILRGFAFTKPDGLVLDMFAFHDAERFLELNPGSDEQLLRAVEDAIVGRLDVDKRLRGREEGAFRRALPRMAPVVHCDNDSSRRYTIVEIVADDAHGLLYRMSRTMSELGCEVDLVLIATEGRRAVDVFHLTREAQKLTAAQQEELTATLQRVLEGRS